MNSVHDPHPFEHPSPVNFPRTIMDKEIPNILFESLETFPKDQSPPTSDAMKMTFDSNQKWFWDVSNVMIRGFTFYLAFMAAAIGYVAAGEVPEEMIRLILILTLAISAIFILGWWACVAVLKTCITVLERIRSQLLTDPSLKNLRLPDTLASSRQSILAISIGINAAVALFVVAVIWLWNSIPFQK